jgi:uncharacterized membrane protein YeaQ/YmgE (transglycosylase-associated protein family)
MLGFLLALVLTGIIVGGLARLALPGRDPMSIPQTIALGIAGSLIGGIVVYAISNGNYSAGIPVSVACSAGLLYIRRRRAGGGLARPSA